MRLGVRPRLWTERGGWGDLGCVLTSGRDGRGWLNRQAAAVLAGSSVFTMRRRFGGPAVSGWGSLDAAPHRASAGHDGFAWRLEIAVGRELVQSWPWWLQQNRERKGYRDLMGTTSKRAGNGKTERKRRDEHNDVLTFGQRWTTMTEELAGVAEESPELGKMTESTSESRDWPHHGIELDKGNSRVVSYLHRKCTVSLEKLTGSSPEFNICKSSARVCGS
jgi:hypothetical protein